MCSLFIQGPFLWKRSTIMRHKLQCSQFSTENTYPQHMALTYVKLSADVYYYNWKSFIRMKLLIHSVKLDLFIWWVTIVMMCDLIKYLPGRLKLCLYPLYILGWHCQFCNQRSFNSNKYKGMWSGIIGENRELCTFGGRHGSIYRWLIKKAWYCATLTDVE